jgi:hypothetical protein
MAKPRELPGWPPAMCEEWAAAYVGQLSVSAFRTEVKAGRIAAAVQLTAGRKAWLREDLDAYLDAKRSKQSDRPHESSPEHLATEWDIACNDSRADRLPSH